MSKAAQNSQHSKSSHSKF
jgi:hypothetical protein